MKREVLARRSAQESNASRRGLNSQVVFEPEDGESQTAEDFARRDSGGTHTGDQQAGAAHGRTRDRRRLGLLEEERRALNGRAVRRTVP